MSGSCLHLGRHMVLAVIVIIVVLKVVITRSVTVVVLNSSFLRDNWNSNAFLNWELRAGALVIIIFIFIIINVVEAHVAASIGGHQLTATILHVVITVDVVILILTIIKCSALLLTRVLRGVLITLVTIAVGAMFQQVVLRVVWHVLHPLCITKTRVTRIDKKLCPNNERKRPNIVNVFNFVVFRFILVFIHGVIVQPQGLNAVLEGGHQDFLHIWYIFRRGIIFTLFITVTVTVIIFIDAIFYELSVSQHHKLIESIV
mmetsp:Transcript_23476/g.39836  ORF Transcript_23476/g.39836 Transcript_23476/m.39836 type:complete len:259 (+) Transcript_23476:127-903(+)